MLLMYDENVRYVTSTLTPVVIVLVTLLGLTLPYPL